MIRFLGPLVGTILVTLLSNNPAVAQNSVDCDAAVVANGSSLEVASDPGNDTENLQCALDKAVAENYTSVLMLDASYSIGSVTATEFSGLLSGKSSRATTVTIEAGGVDCAAPDPSALRFYVGAATVKGMTINVEELCGSTGEQAAVIGFYSDAADCDSRTTFGNVDRVVMQGPGSGASDVLTAIRMTNADTCDSKILGTLKVNRSEIDGFAMGVLSSIGGAGQVDINFNTFTNMGTGIAIANANQGSSIAGNTINYNQVDSFSGVAGLGATGIYVAGDGNSPSSNLTSIKSNKFYDGGEGPAGFAVLVGQEDNKISHTMWVSNNRFEGVQASGSARSPADSGMVMASADPTTPIEYAQDWEGDPNEALGGWLAYIEAFDTDCSTYRGYGYFYTIGGPQVAVIADGAESKVLNVFSNYDDGNMPDICLKTSVFREYTLTEENVGDYSFDYITEPPELVGPQTNAFIKVLDPQAGYTTMGISSTPSTEGEQSVSFTVDETMIGKLLQVGFDTTAAGFENSGMQYDNLVFGAASASGGGGNGGGEPSGSGSGYGVAVLDTDGVIVSGNRFINGAASWVLAGTSSASSVTGWSVVDNTFSGSSAAADIALGANTSDGVVGPGQNSPDVVDDGANDILDGSSVSGDTDAMSLEAADQADLLWGLITGS